MTFLYNKDILNFLDKALNKKAQQNVDTGYIAKKLVNNLDKQFNPNQEAPKEALVTTDMPNGAQLNVAALQSDSTFFKFLADNKIKYDGKRIAYMEPEYKALSEDDRYKLQELSVDNERSTNRDINESNCFYDEQAVVGYVKYLQDKAKTMMDSGNQQGKILLLMLNKISVKVNEVTKDVLKEHNGDGYEQSTSTQTAGYSNTKGLSKGDLTPIDSFGTKTFDTKNPRADKGGAVQLFAKDIISKESLNAWLEDAPMAEVVDYTSGSPVTKKINDDSLNLCYFANAMYSRANSYKNNADSKESIQVINYYIAQMQKILPQYTDPQGKACKIMNQAPDDSKSNNQSKSNSKNGLTAQDVQHIISDLPLNTQNIDLDKIGNFLKTLAPFNPNVEQIEATVQDLRSKVEFYSLSDIIPLTTQKTELGRILKYQTGKLNFVDLLIDLMSQVESALNILYNKFVQTNQITEPEDVRKIEAQIYGSGSIFQRNMSILRDWATIKPL